MGKSLSVLLIEDNLVLARQVVSFLEGLQWQVDFASQGKQGQQLALEHYFDVVVLDLNLPDCDGLDVCQHIKANANRMVPVLMLTARYAFEDKAKGFNYGADDYLTKPFDLRELALRCEAMARRPTLHHETILQRGALTLDSRSFSVVWQQTPVKVTKLGFEILKKLAEDYPHPVARSDLISHLWGDSPPQSNALKSHMYSLRKALEQASQQPILYTISNIGYQLKGIESED